MGVLGHLVVWFVERVFPNSSLNRSLPWWTYPLGMIGSGLFFATLFWLIYR